MDKLVCNWDGKPLNGWRGYKKVAMWTQRFFPLNLWQVLFGDNQVLRFCNEDCFIAFSTAGRLKELAQQ